MASSQLVENYCFCGDVCSGNHFKVLTCEGCKAFFRRAIQRNLYRGPCNRTAFRSETGYCRDWRHKCKECRLQMCLAEGMQIPTPGGVVEAHGGRSGSTDTQDRSISTSSAPEMSIVSTMMQSNTYHQVDIPKSLETRNDDTVIRQLVYSQYEWKHPREADMQRIAGIAEILRKEGKNCGNDVFFKYITELTAIVMYLIEQEARQIPEFSNLHPDDQILLLENSYSAVMMIRAARHYCLESESILFVHNLRFDREDYRKAGALKSVDHVFNFCANFCRLGLDDAEQALLFAILIFSDRKNLIDEKLVAEYQDKYKVMLIQYMMISRYPNPAYAIAKAFRVLTEVRKLGKLDYDDQLNLLRSGHELPTKLRTRLDSDSSKLLAKLQSHFPVELDRMIADYDWDSMTDFGNI